MLQDRGKLSLLRYFCASQVATRAVAEDPKALEVLKKGFTVSPKVFISLAWLPSSHDVGLVPDYLENNNYLPFLREACVIINKEVSSVTCRLFVGCGNRLPSWQGSWSRPVRDNSPCHV